MRWGCTQSFLVDLLTRKAFTPHVKTWLWRKKKKGKLQTRWPLPSARCCCQTTAVVLRHRVQSFDISIEISKYGYLWPHRPRNQLSPRSPCSPARRRSSGKTQPGVPPWRPCYESRTRAGAPSYGPRRCRAPVAPRRRNENKKNVQNSEWTSNEQRRDLLQEAEAIDHNVCGAVLQSAEAMSLTVDRTSHEFLNPFIRNALPFWGQIIWNKSQFVPKNGSSVVKTGLRFLEGEEELLKYGTSGRPFTSFVVLYPRLTVVLSGQEAWLLLFFFSKVRFWGGAGER